MRCGEISCSIVLILERKASLAAADSCCFASVMAVKLRRSVVAGLVKDVGARGWKVGWCMILARSSRSTTSPLRDAGDDQFCDVCPDERDVLDGLFWDLQSLAEPPDAPDLLSAESSEVED